MLIYYLSTFVCPKHENTRSPPECVRKVGLHNEGIQTPHSVTPTYIHIAINIVPFIKIKSLAYGGNFYKHLSVMLNTVRYALTSNGVHARIICICLCFSSWIALT